MSELADAQATETGVRISALDSLTLARETQRRYHKALCALADDAREHEATGILVDTLTWSLARIAVAHGTPAVTGDILRRLGDHMDELSAQLRALREADEAKKNGQKPH